MIPPDTDRRTLEIMAECAYEADDRLEAINRLYALDRLVDPPEEPEGTLTVYVWQAPFENIEIKPRDHELCEDAGSSDGTGTGGTT